MAGGTGAADFGSYQNWAIAFLTLVVVIICNMFGKGYIKISAMLIGIGVGYAVSFATGMVSFGNVAESSWISLPRFSIGD